MPPRLLAVGARASSRGVRRGDAQDEISEIKLFLDFFRLKILNILFLEKKIELKAKIPFCIICNIPRRKQSNIALSLLSFLP